MIMILRKADIGDEQFLLELRNHPDLVPWGTSQRPVTAEEHAEWFHNRLWKSGNLLQVITLESGGRVGFVRFSILNPEEAEISIGIHPDYWGQRRGTSAIRVACHMLRYEIPDCCVIAKIHKDNQRSIRAFTNAGFVPMPGGEEPFILMENSPHD